MAKNTAPAADAQPAKAKAPALDLSSLTVGDAVVPAQTRARKVQDNPFLAHLRASRENDNAGKAVTVPEANVGDVKYLIRQASNDLACGARIVEQANDNGTVTVLFSAKDRRVRRTKAEVEAAKAAEAAAQG